VAAVATALAELHEAGLAHGDVRGEAVLVGAGGLVELQPGPGVGAPADDVAAAGRLLERLCELCPPRSRGRRARRGRSLLRPPEPVAALRSLGERAADPEPERRLSARSLAAAALDRVPDACLPGSRPEAVPEQSARPRRRRVVPIAAAVVAAVLAATAAVRFAGAGRDRAGPTTAGRQFAGAPVDYTGGVLTAAGTRYAVGQPGDVVAVADWGCSGRATVALLRPGTGQVWLFPSWAAGGEDVTARLVGRVDDAVGLAARPGPTPACPALEVSRAAGGPTVLAVPKEAP